MFDNLFDQNNEPDELSVDPEYWVDTPAQWQEDGSDWDDDGGDYPSSDYLPDDYPSGDYFPDDYQSIDYSSTVSPLAFLPKLLIVCTMLACLLLVGVLSLVSVEVNYGDGNTADQSNSSIAQTGVQDQSQTGLGAQSNPDTALCEVSQRFPVSIRRWCGLITQYAAKHGLPPNLVAALIWQESGGNPVAYSHSGAVGLMQIMPSDGLAASFQCAGGPCFSSRPNTNQLQDPEFNVSYGTRMLAGLIGKTGNLRDALKSYGPMNVGYYYADKVLGIYQNYGD
jgi:hypothetical protein